MARKRYLSGLRPLSDVQLTSFMDLSFLLLVTFIITFPLIEQGIPVNLPKGSAEDIKADKVHSITLDIKGSIYLDNVVISMEQLRASLEKLAKADPKVSVSLRADEDIDYGRVMKIVRLLHEKKITRMALVTQADDKAGS